MMNRECDIIRDLLPSYVDEICSEATKEWVEEHLISCKSCQKTFDLMRNTEISAHKHEKSSFDAMKKIKLQAIQRGITTYGLCIFLILLIFFVCVLYTNSIITELLYIVLPICLLATYLLIQTQTKPREIDNLDKIFLVGVVLTIMYGLGIMLTLIICFIQGTQIPFQIPVNKLGPIIYWQLLIIAGIQLSAYVIQVTRTMKRGKNTVTSLTIHCSQINIFAIMACIVQLGLMESPEHALEYFGRNVFVILGIGLICVVGFIIMDKRKTNWLVDI